MNILFVCNQGQNRSRTAAELFGKSFNTRYAGLYSIEPLDTETMEWADVIMVMEDHQRKELSKRFPKQYLQKRIINLDIPDIYRYRQPELIKILNERFSQAMTIIA